MMMMMMMIMDMMDRTARLINVMTLKVGRFSFLVGLSLF